MSKQKVSRAADWTVAPMSVHLHVPMPPGVAPPVPLPHVEIPTPMQYPPGKWAHAFTKSVFHKGTTLALDGHDCGVGILHVSVPPLPANLLLALIIPFSSRKMNFSASTVLMDGSATGVSDHLGVPTPMSACAEPISLPVVFPITNSLNTVNVGATVGDLLAGWAGIAVSAVFDSIFEATLGRFFEKKAFDLGMMVVGKFLGFGPDPKGVAKFAAKAAVGLLMGAVNHVRTGKGSYSVGAGNRVYGIKFSVKTDGKGGKTIGVKVWGFGHKSGSEVNFGGHSPSGGHAAEITPVLLPQEKPL